MFWPSWYFLFLLIGEAICFRITPYDVKLVSLSAWPENAEFDISKVRLIGRERLLNGTLTLTRDVDNDHYSFSGEAFCDAAGDGNFKLLPFPNKANQFALISVIKFALEERRSSGSKKGLFS